MLGSLNSCIGLENLEMAQVFSHDEVLGTGVVTGRESLLPGGLVMEGLANGDGLGYQFEKGLLTKFTWLTLDMLLEGTELCVFSLALREEGADAAEAEMHWGLLNWCQARARVPLSFVNQNRWMFTREGAWLKPCAGGKRVDLAKVDRMTLKVFRIGPTVPVRWHMTALTAQVEEPVKLETPLLPKGVLVDEMGQSMLHQWAGRTKSVEEVTGRIRQQLTEAGSVKWPTNFSQWGGWKDGPQQKATGYFGTHFDGKRWWLVDPEGYLFWSAGMDCVGPRAESNVTGLKGALTWMPDKQVEFADAVSKKAGEVPGVHVSYLVTNMIRAVGASNWEKSWGTIALSQLRSFGMNTMANWSDWEVAKAGSFPYVRPLREHFDTTPRVFRDFPDVWHENFASDCAEYAEQLRETIGDPAMIGYFLMNEPTWGFAMESPALGMLYNTPEAKARTALANFMREKYATDEKLSEAWGVATNFSELEKSLWSKPVSAAMTTDLESFSTVMIDRMFAGMTDACRKVDPHHMNLGARYYKVPPEWCLAGMTRFDVFSLNAYARKVPAADYDLIAAKLKRPVLAGEWHFGALDVGLPSSGIGHVTSEVERGKAYRVYTENAAACKSCVGVHYFQMYDQSALGRFDGENYNIGFVDVCSRPYPEMLKAAREAHGRMYDVAAGKAAAFDEDVKHLPLLFI